MNKLMWFIVALVLICIAAIIMVEKDAEQIEETAE